PILLLSSPSLHDALPISEFYVIIYLYNRHVITVLNDETIFFFTSLSIWSVVHVLLPVNLCLLRATHLYIAVLRQSGMIFDSLTALNPLASATTSITASEWIYRSSE